MRKKRFLLIILCFLLAAAMLPHRSFAASSAGTVRLCEAAELPAAPEIQSDYAILMEMKSGAILYEKNAYERANPASTTKILTALLVMENLTLSDSLTFSYRATHELPAGSSSIYRTENEVMTVEDCLYALMVASANEVAQALGEEISGSFEAFAAKMTLRAYELGAVNSNFVNAHGVTDPDHYTCAYDMALFTRAALQYSKLKEIMGTVKYQIAPTNKHDEITYMRSHHALLTDTDNMRYAAAVAGKTGYTDAAQNCLVTYAVQGGLDLICVVFHGEGSDVVGRDSIALFDYGFRHFSCYNLNTAESVLQNENSRFLGSNILQFTQSGESYVCLPQPMTLSDLSTDLVFHTDASDGSSNTVAERIYTLNGTKVGSCLLNVGSASANVNMTPLVKIAPTTNERLRTEYFGLALIYWILIGGGVALLLILTLIILLVRRLILRRRRIERQKRRALSRLSEDQKPMILP
ncbi:MAG: D-alanyl-D-alanine carboxypeptidase [Lachnospiraceae bacterium]|nr:D-alanyl-D-alanine carboxypeptidase [Lachnospiraceae bacterium]